MKRLLYLPLLVPGGANEQHDLLQAFMKEYDVAWVDHYNSADAVSEIRMLFKTFKPDIVHAQFSDKIPRRFVREMRQQAPNVIWTQWTGDADREPIPHTVAYGLEVHATLLATGQGQQRAYQRAMGGGKVFWWQHAVADWQFREPIDEPLKSAIVMVGNNYGVSEERIEIATKMTDAFENFTVYGDGYSEPIRRGGRIPWRDQTPLYNQAALSIGTNMFNNIQGYFSDRPLIAMAAGTCHLMRYVPGLEELFEDGKDCVFFKTPDEAVERATYLMKHPAERAKIAKHGQKIMRDKHTFDVRVKEYQKIVEKL